MLLSPSFIQGVSFFLSAELLASLIVFRTVKPDKSALYVREIGVIILTASIPTLIYLTIFYIAKIIMLFVVFATITIAHISILMHNEREYVNSGAAAIIGFIVGAFLFGWGIFAGLLVLIASKFYELKVKVPEQARLGLMYFRNYMVVLIFLLNLIATYLAFGGVI